MKYIFVALVIALTTLAVVFLGPNGLLLAPIAALFVLLTMVPMLHHSWHHERELPYEYSGE